MPMVVCIPGNHDLPNHNLDLIEKSGLWTLEKAGKVKIIPCALGRIGVFMIGEFEVGITHQLINHPQSDTTAKDLLKRTDVDLLITGDNHMTFVEEHKGKLLINPGSLSRQTAAQEEHKPCVFLYSISRGEYQSVSVPIEPDVIQREHLEKQEQREDRMERFMDSMKSGYEIGLDFPENMKTWLKKNRQSKTVNEMIWESING
jgi:predicted phosphodiesterase